MTSMHALLRTLGSALLTGAIISPGSQRPPVPTFERVYSLAPREGVFAYARISPDGQLLVYASETPRPGGRNLIDRTVTIVDLPTRKVLFTELGVDGYWSNDGRRMIFLSEAEGLARVSVRHVDGGVVRDIAPVPLGGYYSWGNRGGRDLVLTISGNFYYLDGDRAVLPAERALRAYRRGGAATSVKGRQAHYDVPARHDRRT